MKPSCPRTTKYRWWTQILVQTYFEKNLGLCLMWSKHFGSKFCHWPHGVLGGSAGSEAVVGVWSCLVHFHRQLCWHVDRSSSLYKDPRRIPVWSEQIPLTHMATASMIWTHPLYSSHQLVPLPWFQNLIFVCSCLSTSCHFLAVSIPACRYPCLLLPPSMDIEADYCQHWPPGVQEMPWKWLL